MTVDSLQRRTDSPICTRYVDMQKEQGEAEEQRGCSLCLYKINRPQAIDFSYTQYSQTWLLNKVLAIISALWFCATRARSFKAIKQSLLRHPKVVSKGAN